MATTAADSVCVLPALRRLLFGTLAEGRSGSLGKHNVLVHTHAAENLEEIDLVMRQRGMRNIVVFGPYRLASPRLVLAHCIWLDDEERDILRRTGTRMTHCPGLQPEAGVRRRTRAGAAGTRHRIGIGADGAPCNNTLDMFQEMRLTALLHKVRSVRKR